MTSAQNNCQVTMFRPRHTEIPVSTGSAVQLAALVGPSRATDKPNAVGQRGSVPRQLLHMIQHRVILEGPCAMSTHPEGGLNWQEL